MYLKKIIQVRLENRELEQIIGSMCFLFNDQYPYEINKFFIQNEGFRNLMIPVPPFKEGERISISLTVGYSKQYYKYHIYFNSLVLLMKNSNGFLPD